MNWMTKFLMGQMLLMDKNKDGDGGGGGGGGGSAPTKEEFDALKKQNADLLARFEALEKKEKGTGGKDENDPDLADKARKEREAKDAESKKTAKLERALKFNIAGPEFMKANATLLPKSVESIWTQAEKENYGSAIEKAAAIQVGIISEFFALEENMAQLTGPQKFQVEEFKRLTKTDKQDRVEQIWDSIFEPTFEMVKKIKRAQEMANGQKSQSDGEKALADRMMKMSKKHYLGEKDA